ncbi:MAG TPA: MaoC family dehydratase N-terminal domain-containing protein [Mycobacteriales bacterium]|nr:MaoC family dehydratase N-terminal domain-containing protein [Mycobacteriales bacterium]
MGTAMAADELVAELRAFVGSEGPVQTARHPVNGPAIADWCDAIGDGNPVYTDEEAAAKSRHGGIVAPPATLDIWDRPGLPAQPRWRPAGLAPAEDPRSHVMRKLEDAGFIGVVAVNSELEIARYLRPGDLLQNKQVLEDVSEEKHTALGVGHFVTTRQRYETVDREHVGDLLFRILKFKPNTGKAAAPAEGDRPAPDPSPSLRPRPGINRDNQALFDGYRLHELRVPQCQGCRRVFFPPAPRCAACGSFEMGYAVASGRGTLHSFTVVHHPQVPGFRYPLVVGLVELEPPDTGGPGGSAVRIVADLVGVRPDQVEVGMPLEVDWLDSHPAQVDGATDSRGPITVPQFRPATPRRREDTVVASALRDGERLPLWTLPLSPTHIVAGALATRDFQDVHHDRDLAHQKGSQDIFLNINTSLGYMERYVTDFLGPEAVVSALRVRLGAPAYPYLPLTFTGSVQSVDRETGRVVVGVQASNDLGPHITGTVELELQP